MMAIVVNGATCSLGEAVVDKLLSMDIDVIVSEESHKLRNETLLKFSQAKLLSEGDGFSVSFDGSVADLEIGNHIVIHDLIPTRVDRWMPEEIVQWSKQEEAECQPRYWVSVIDAANAIAHIAKSEINVSQMNLCGRREWLPEDSKAEFDMLWSRTNQGLTGEFTAETLFGHEIAGMHAKPISSENNTRPDIDSLHDVLVDITGDGWRPLVPLRTALMALIADMLA